MPVPDQFPFRAIARRRCRHDDLVARAGIGSSGQVLLGQHIESLEVTFAIGHQAPYRGAVGGFYVYRHRTIAPNALVADEIAVVDAYDGIQGVGQLGHGQIEGKFLICRRVCPGRCRVYVVVVADFQHNAVAGVAQAGAQLVPVGCGRQHRAKLLFVRVFAFVQRRHFDRRIGVGIVDRDVKPAVDAADVKPALVAGPPFAVVGSGFDDEVRSEGHVVAHHCKVGAAGAQQRLVVVDFAGNMPGAARQFVFFLAGRKGNAVVELCF